MTQNAIYRHTIQYIIHCVERNSIIMRTFNIRMNNWYYGISPNYSVSSVLSGNRNFWTINTNHTHFFNNSLMLSLLYIAINYWLLMQVQWKLYDATNALHRVNALFLYVCPYHNPLQIRANPNCLDFRLFWSIITNNIGKYNFLTQLACCWDSAMSIFEFLTLN